MANAKAPPNDHEWAARSRLQAPSTLAVGTSAGRRFDDLPVMRLAVPIGLFVHDGRQGCADAVRGMMTRIAVAIEQLADVRRVSNRSYIFWALPNRRKAIDVYG